MICIVVLSLNPVQGQSVPCRTVEAVTGGVSNRLAFREAYSAARAFRRQFIGESEVNIVRL
jgi:hypothetical protein